jgi:hypothetical protein
MQVGCFRAEPIAQHHGDSQRRSDKNRQRGFQNVRRLAVQLSADGVKMRPDRVWKRTDTRRGAGRSLADVRRPKGVDTSTRHRKRAADAPLPPPPPKS